MCTAIAEKRHCISCNKSDGILTCDGCQQTFCGKHVMEHRQQLANQLEGIMQEHDSIQQDLGRASNQHPLLRKIDKWEQESITKIQVAAETARVDMRQMLDSSTKRISKACRDIAIHLRSAREADDFSEIDLNRWTKRLSDLKQEMVSPSRIKITENANSAIRFIAVGCDDSGSEASIEGTKSSISKIGKKRFFFNTEERFFDVRGPAVLSDTNLCVTFNSSEEGFAYIRGQQIYFISRHTVRFRIEQSKTFYNTFFGCISSKTAPEMIDCCSPFSTGWFGYNQVYRHNAWDDDYKKHGYQSGEIKTNDVLQLTLDCDKRQIELFHERTNKRHAIRVDIRKAPFPWQILVILRQPNDCVRILTNN